MKLVRFSKYKNYLESLGYIQEKNFDEYRYPLFYRTYYFSKSNNPNKYIVNVYIKVDSKDIIMTDNIMSILFGYGSLYNGKIKKIKIDKRQNFWKQFI